MITKVDLKNKTITSYAIRKLTPRECFRLMGVKEYVIDRMQTKVKKIRGKDKKEVEVYAVSSSQQYKQAGNSIVTNCMLHIFENLYYPDAQPKKKVVRQLDLFDFLTETNEVKDIGLLKAPIDGVHNVITTFSGYDSQCLALDMLKEKHPDFKYDLVAWSEIDWYAIQMHNLIYPNWADRCVGDITKVDWKQFEHMDIDLLTYSSPCQDISQAGKQMGVTEGSGTRSALLWNVVDAIEATHPRYLLQENVAALVSKKFMPDFQMWLNKLDELGYDSFWQLMNAKDYGVPQNRNRVFCISIRKDIAKRYRFPEPFELTTHLEDILQDEVDESFFLADKTVGKFMEAKQSDGEVFVTFDCGITHEDAMFIKTWLGIQMEAYKLWDKSAPEVKKYIEEQIMPLFPEDWRNCDCMKREKFMEIYNKYLHKQR